MHIIQASCAGWPCLAGVSVRGGFPTSLCPFLPPSSSSSFPDFSEAAEGPQGWDSGDGAPPKMEKEEKAHQPPVVLQSGIPVRAPGPEGLAAKMPVGRTNLPIPCQTFPACHRNGGEAAVAGGLAGHSLAFAGWGL